MDHCQGSPCLIISGSIGVRCLFIDGERAEKGARCDKYHDRTLLIGSPARALVIKLGFCNQAGDSLGRQCELIPLYAGVFCCLFDASRAGRRSALCLRKTPTPRDIYEIKESMLCAFPISQCVGLCLGVIRSPVLVSFLGPCAFCVTFSNHAERWLFFFLLYASCAETRTDSS